MGLQLTQNMRGSGTEALDSEMDGNGASNTRLQWSCAVDIRSYQLVRFARARELEARYVRH